MRTELHIVDWDTVTLAPKERDLMFPARVCSASGSRPSERKTGFTATAKWPSTATLAYYRCERSCRMRSSATRFTFGADNPDRQRPAPAERPVRPGAVVDLALNTEPESPVT